MAFIKINKHNFYHNLSQIALKTGSIDKIAIVLKDNAYGHGLELMGQLASAFGIKHAVVRKRTEADRIRPFFQTILVLGDTIVQDAKYSFALNTLADISHAQKGAKVELKVDTGMHRNGIALDEVDEALGLIAKNGLELIGVMTHYRSADALSSELFWQQKRFDAVKRKVSQAGFSGVRYHSHNSAAILRSRNFDEDLVRVGIAAYGYHDLAYPFDEITLKPVLSLHAKRVASRRVDTGDRIGYGGDYTALTPMRVSTYDLGYGDGWCRGESKSPFMTAEGLPILGRVSMDFISLACEKEEICVVCDAQDAARQLGTISYEITTALSCEIERKVID